MFLKSLKACFLSRTSANTFSRSIFDKHKRWKNFNFLTKIMDYPLCKNAQFCLPFKSMFILSRKACFQFCGCLKPMFRLFTKACLLYKTFKIVFLRFILTIYDMGIQGVTRGYKGWQEVTKGYMGLQEATRGYKGLQQVKRGYNGWQGVTTGYRGLQGVTWCYKGLQAVTKDYRNFF